MKGRRVWGPGGPAAGAQQGRHCPGQWGAASYAYAASQTESSSGQQGAAVEGRVMHVIIALSDHGVGASAGTYFPPITVSPFKPSEHTPKLLQLET